MDILLTVTKCIRQGAPFVLVCLVVAGVVIAPEQMYAATAYVQDTEGFKSGTAPLTTAAFSSNTTSGNLIVVAASWDSCGNAEITDNKGNTYVAATVKQSGSVICSQIFYAENITGGSSHTVTISATSGTVEYIKLVVHEVSGVATSGALDKNASATGSGASQSVGPVVTTADGEYIFATASEETQSNNNYSASGVYTERETADDAGAWQTQTQDYVQPSAGSISATWSASSGSSAGTVQMATFFAATPAPSRSTLARPPNNLGLVGYWPMNEATSTQAGDFSGNGNPGTLTGIANPPTSSSGWGPGIRGGAITFDNTNDQVIVTNGSALNFTGEITVSSWIKLNSVSGTHDIVAKTVADGTFDWYLQTNGAEIGFDCLFSGACFENTTNAGLEAGKWYNVVATYKDSTDTIAIYVNGVAKTVSGDPTGSMTSASRPVIIGRAWTGEETNGVIDEVRVYNRALGPTEVAALYGSGAIRLAANSKTLTQGSTLQNGLVGLWTFDGGDINWTSATTGNVVDGSGSGNTGVITNMSRPVSATIGKLGQAFNFDGSDDFVRTSSAFSVGSSVATVAFWLNWTLFENADDAAFTVGDFDTQSAVYDIFPDSSGGTFSFALSGPAGDGRIESISRPAAGEWRHYTVIFDNSTSAGDITVYLDGAVQSTAIDLNTKSASGTLLSDNLVLMAGLEGTANFGNGKLDDFRIYNRALTASEAKQLYQLGQAKITP